MKYLRKRNNYVLDQLRDYKNYFNINYIHDNEDQVVISVDFVKQDRRNNNSKIFRLENTKMEKQSRIDLIYVKTLK